METIWFYQEGDQRRGPVSAEQLLAALGSAPNPSQVLVWHAGLAGWTAAGSVPEISQQLPPPLPLPSAPMDPRFRPVPVEEVEGVARLYRRLVLLVGLQLLLSFVQIPMAAVPEAQKAQVGVAVLAILLVVLVAIAVTAYRLTLLMVEGSPVFWAIAMFLPCLNILMLLVLSSKAQDWCRRYGVKVGFLGPTQESIEELRRKALH
jgi:hypothetical protein